MTHDPQVGSAQDEATARAIIAELAAAAATDPRLSTGPLTRACAWTAALPPAARRQMLDDLVARISGTSLPGEQEAVLTAALGRWRTTAAAFSRR